MRLFYVALLLPGLVYGQDIGCFVPGSCEHSNEVGISFPQDSNGCLSSCKDSAECEYFSYQYADDFCVLFTECTSYSSDLATVSGQKSCDYLVCGNTGECEDQALDTVQVLDEAECIDLCVADTRCSWWSYNADGSSMMCSLFSSCDSVSTACSNCAYGQRSCREGAPGTIPPTTAQTTTPSGPDPNGLNTLVIFSEYGTGEVVSLEGKTCDEILPLPDYSSVPLSFSTDQGKYPVVCSTFYCHQYDGEAWNEIDGPNHSRSHAAGTQIDDDTYWSIGGESFPLSGETFNGTSMRWSIFPDPPSITYKSCAATLDNRYVYISGGALLEDQGLSTTHMYDWVEGTFTELPPSPYVHYDAACGIAKTSRGPEFVIAGNREEYYVDIYNINSGTWRTGGSMNSISTEPASVQYKDTFLYVFATSIYEWDPVQDTFITRPEPITNYFSYDPTAVLLDGSIFNCA